jgi:polyhydroxybutyrate depolymerase
MVRMIAALAVLFLSLQATPAAQAAEASRTMVRDGVERHFIVADPSGTPGPKPLVIVLHGGGGNIDVMRRVGFEPIAGKENFLVVYPQGQGNGWRDGREGRVVEDRSGDVDDVAFLTAIIDALIAEGRADSRRVYVLGASNGGMMSLRMACERADRLAGIVAVIALLPEDIEHACKPSEPLPMMLMVGTADRFVPFNGGPVAGFLNDERGGVVSYDRTMAVLLAANRCKGEPTATALPDPFDDGVSTTRLDWTACAPRGQVSVLRMEGAGHGWPGKPRPSTGRPIEAMRGTVSRDFDGAEAAWAFLRTQSRP